MKFTAVGTHFLTGVFVAVTFAVAQAPLIKSRQQNTRLLLLLVALCVF